MEHKSVYMYWGALLHMCCGGSGGGLYSLLWLQREMHEIWSLIKVTSLEATLVGFEDYKFRDEKQSESVELERSYLNRLLLLTPHLAAQGYIRYIIHPNLQFPCLKSRPWGCTWMGGTLKNCFILFRCPNHLPQLTPLYLEEQQQFYAELLPDLQAPPGSPSSSWISKLLILFLTLSPATLLGKLILAACFHNLVLLDYPQFINNS